MGVLGLLRLLANMVLLWDFARNDLRKWKSRWRTEGLQNAGLSGSRNLAA